jgi:transcriptional regulator GlxA family with amidase domain
VDEPIAAMRFIAQRAGQRISVNDVAEAAGASRRTLETRFEKHLGRTVATEIHRGRVDWAKRLLASSAESIAQIGGLTCIGTPQKFARVLSPGRRRLAARVPKSVCRQ